MSDDAPADADTEREADGEAGTAEPGKEACVGAADGEPLGIADVTGARPDTGVTRCTFTGGAAAKVGAGGASASTAGGGVTATGDAVPVGVAPMRDELTMSRAASAAGDAVG